MLPQICIHKDHVKVADTIEELGIMPENAILRGLDWQRSSEANGEKIIELIAIIYNEDDGWQCGLLSDTV